MMPDPTSRSLKDEKINSPTHLLAATWAFRISNIFGKGTTQRKIQDVYQCAGQAVGGLHNGEEISGGSLIEKGGCPDPTRDPQHERSHPHLPNRLQ